eukprot:m.20197 g.20197  ORF g.20197 m.20197 type:complete len:225 (+) comp8829_c0_seq1:228-902(+)
MVKKASSGRSSARPRKANSMVEEPKEVVPPSEEEIVDDRSDSVHPDALIPGVPKGITPLPRTLPVSDRLFSPLLASSEEGKYLKEKLWPTLELALDKLTLAIKYHIPRDVRQQYQDPGMARIRHPEHAINFRPIEWLATFLKRHNPYNPPALTPDAAAARIQAAFRGSQVRKRYKIQREEARHQKEQELLAQRREAAAIKIQAVYRGHSVRLDLAMGKLQPQAR